MLAAAKIWHGPAQLQKWIHVMYLWSLQTSQEKVAEILQISKPTLVSLYITMREIADMYLQAHPIELGGPSRIVQIDESCFSHKRKYQRGIQNCGIHKRKYQNVESYWNRVKVGLKSMKGVRRQFLHFYLQEFMWRERCRSTGENIFSKLIEHIALFYDV